MPARPIVTDEPTGVLHAKARASHIELLDAYAKAEGITRAAAVRRAVEEFVTRDDVRAVAGVKSRKRGAAKSA